MESQNNINNYNRIFPEVSSTHGGDEVRVRFYNLTTRSVDLIWMRDKDSPTKYGTLKTKQYLDIRTFEGHPWVFRRTIDGAPMCVNQEFVFWPVSKGRNVVVRDSHFISFPMMSLAELSARRLLLPGSFLSHEDVDRMPKCLRELVEELRLQAVAYSEAIVRPPFLAPVRR